MNNAKKKSPLIRQYYDAAIWIQERTCRFPKVERSALVPQIGNLCLKILLLLVEAYYSHQKLAHLMDANLKLEQLRFLMRMSKDRKFISINQYSYISKQLIEIGKQLGGWINHQHNIED